MCILLLLYSDSFQCKDIFAIEFLTRNGVLINKQLLRFSNLTCFDYLGGGHLDENDLLQQQKRLCQEFVRLLSN